MSRDFIPPSHYDPTVVALEKTIELAKNSGAAPDLVEALEGVRNLVTDREQYTLNTTTKESETCRDIFEKTNKHDWETPFEEGKTTWLLRPFMMSGALEGQFLKSVVSLQKAKRILDIGMFSGYSAVSMAEALPEDGEMVTIDQDDYLKDFVEEAVKSSPHHYKIKILIGKALGLLQQMVDNGEKFDIIFLDADKGEYIEYFKFAFEKNLLSPGGTVLVDNACMFGEGYMKSFGETDSKIFARAVASNPDLHSVLVPIRDGILIIRRLSDVEGDVRKA